VVSLDSSFLIDLLAGEARAVERASALDRSRTPKFVTPPAAAEVLVGAYLVGGEYLAQAKALVDGLTLLPFDREASHEAARLSAELLRRGTPVGQGDLFIAAISKRHGEAVLTRDKRFGWIPGLSVVTY